jgi:hypothetical protein
MNILRYLLPAAAVLSLGLWANSASAQCGGFGGYDGFTGSFGTLNAYGSGGTLYGSGYIPVPPYFSIHPPVYYSHQYYRPYGWTPFAQPSYMGAAVLRPEPRMVVNQYVKKSTKDAARPADNTAKAEVIVNPFYVKQETTSQGRLVSAEQ